MPLTRWNPLRELERLSDRFTRFARSDREEMADTESMTAADWYSPVDIFETPQEFYLKMELPEVKKRDLRVRVQDGVLFVHGERQAEPEANGHKIHRLERPYGRFVRRFTLPESIDAAKVKAEFREGILYVHLPNPRSRKREPLR